MSHQTISFRGASRTQYRFNLYRWGQAFPVFGAVYAVLRHDGNRGYSVLYFGQTGDITKRFDDHHKQRCFDRNLGTHVAVLGEPLDQRSRDIEADLIQAYSPPCNGD